MSRAALAMVERMLREDAISAASFSFRVGVVLVLLIQLIIALSSRWWLVSITSPDPSEFITKIS